MAVRDAVSGLGIGSIFGVAMDVLVTGGDTIFLLGSILIDQGPLLFLFLSRLLAAAPEISWLPEARLETLFVAVALLLAAVTLYRLLNNVSERLSNET